MPTIHRGAAAVLPALAAASAAHAGVVIADSAADFGVAQGGNGWHYGYIAPASGPEFIPFPNFGMHAGRPGPAEEPAWYIEYSGEPILFPTPYTHLVATGGHPNTGDPAAGPVHWTVRRWISSVSGPIDISGIFGDYTPDFGAPGVMDGVFGEIVVDGAVVWSMGTTGLTPDSPFSATALVTVGSVVDFVVRPNQNQDNDFYTWTVQIVPGPSPAALILSSLMLGAPRRRRSARG